jgi:hypothetical protein
MDIGVAVKPLGAVDSAALEAAIIGADPLAWEEYVERQKSYEVHEQTRSIVLLFAEVSKWPNCDVSREPGWNRFSELAVPLMHEIIGRAYPPGGTIIRAMAAKLLAGGRINLHKDSHPSFAAAHRIHVPLTTNPNVDFLIRGQNHYLEEGVAYEVSNLDYHAVTNRGPDRIHFIFDYTLQ